MSLLCLPAPAWLGLAKALAEATFNRWPDEHPCHFQHKAFQEDTSEVEVGANALGFCYVGCGNFTAVFSHPQAPGLVFKLNAGTRDKMEEYHRWLMEQDHPNLPRVLHVEHYRGGCVAVSERLSPYGPINELPLVDLSNLLSAAGFEIDDAHSGNVMRRESDGLSILNDPSSNRAEDYF